MVKGFSPLVLLGVVVVIVIGGVLVVSQSDLDLQLAPCTPPSCFGGGITPAGKAGNVSRVDPIPDDDNQVKVKFPLFTASEKLYLNDTINKVVQQLGAQQLPTVLKSGTFKGNVNSAYTQELILGGMPDSLPRIVFAKEPQASDNPADGILMSGSTSQFTYALKAVFDKEVDFTSASSKNKMLMLFGKTFKIDPSTNALKLVLVNIKDAQDRLTFQDVQPVKIGINEKPVPGTYVRLNGLGGNTTSMNGITIIVAAQNLSDDFVYKTTLFLDSPLTEHHYVDPVFGTFKLVFGGMKNSGFYAASENQIGDTNDIIAIGPSGTNNQGFNDQVQIDDFRDWRNFTRDIDWYDNSTGHSARLGYDSSDAAQIRVIEGIDLKKYQWAVIGNENYGYLMELISVSNESIGYNDDRIKFKDVLNPSYEEYQAIITSEGVGTLNINGRIYGVTYSGIAGDSDNMIVRLNYPDSSNDGTGIFFPTIQTSMGAKMMLYQPTPINLYTLPTLYGGTQGGSLRIMLPNGNGYSFVDFKPLGNGNYNVSQIGLIGGSFRGVLNTLNVNSLVSFPIGELKYEVRGTGIQNRTTLYLHDVEADGETERILNPALVFFEEADDAGKYEALIVKIKGSATNNSQLSLDDIETTWGDDAMFDNLLAQKSANSDKGYLSQDRYGAITILNDQSPGRPIFTGGILYPDKQSEALVYLQEI